VTKRAHSLTKSNDGNTAVPSARLPRLMDSYILTGDISRISERTLEQRRDFFNKLKYFLGRPGI
jgi:hypothetical protein